MLLSCTAMKLQAAAAILAPVFAVGTPFMWPKVAQLRSSLLDTRPTTVAPAAVVQAPVTPEKPVAKAPAAPVVAPAAPVPAVDTHVEFANLHTSVEQGVITAEFRGNGRDWVRAKLQNHGSTNLKVQVDVGQMFEAGPNAVMVAHPAFLELAPGRTGEMHIDTAALRSMNRNSEQPYRLTHGRMPKIETFLNFVQGRRDMSLGAIQTAVLALTENLPLSAVCKFPTVANEIKSRFNTDAFRVETGDIISALVALREAGVPETAVVMTIDPQLKIESMIDPQCRAQALAYYGITPDVEWAYWKEELLKGDPSTRHYALYGIARYYPDTALEMLPKWARETRTTPVFRLAAVQALAETQRPEALPILRQLATDLGSATELGRAATGAAEYLENVLGSAVIKQQPVAFRVGMTSAQY